METYDNTRFSWIEKLESPRESELSNSLAIANFKTNMVCKNESTIPQICIKSILFLDAIRSVLRNKGFPNTHDICHGCLALPFLPRPLTRKANYFNLQDNVG